METGRIRSTIFWNNVQKVLNDRKLSWQDLSMMTGFSAQSMASARYLCSTLRVITVLRIAQALELSPAALAGVTDCPSTIPTKMTSELLNVACTVPTEISVALVMPTLGDEDKHEMTKLIDNFKAKEGIL